MDNNEKSSIKNKIKHNQNVTYQTCGIENVDEFYKDKFAYAHSYDIQDNYLYEYNILYLKQMFIYDYIKQGSIVLDFGCGSGIFKILKTLGCYIIGIDMSEKSIGFAKELNKYDEVYCLDIMDTFYDKYKNHFDHIISVDVFGHIEFREKDKVINRLKYFLKKNGTMIHGIETGDIKYNEMTLKQRKDFCIVDGHIGMESEEITTIRFQQFFKNVTTRTPYGITNDLNEIIKQNESYAVSYLDPKLISYLKENRSNKLFLDAFNISQYCAYKAHEANIAPNTFFNLYGFSFLVCSDTDIRKYSHTKPQTNIEFGQNFYGKEVLNNKEVRWSQPYSFLSLTNILELEIEINSNIPTYTQKEQNVTILINGKIDKKIEFNSSVSSIKYILRNEEEKENIKLEFYSDASYSPMFFNSNTKDNRILAFKISIVSKKICNHTPLIQRQKSKKTNTKFFLKNIKNVFFK